jgi:membrane protein implicated in regulation of membrane protease activity
MSPTSWLWLAALVFFIIVEAATVQMVSVWFMAGSIAALLASLLNAGLFVEIVVFVLVSAVALLLLRPIAKRRLEAAKVPTNADMAIGGVGIVTEDIENDSARGRVSINNLSWAARSQEGELIKKGEKVRINAISGVKLIVSPIKEEK